MNIKASLSFDQFLAAFGNHEAVAQFSECAQKAIFQQIDLAQKSGADEKDAIDWFQGAEELTSGQVYEKHDEVIDQLGGPMLDLLYESHSDLFKTLKIPFSEDEVGFDEDRTDISYINEHHAKLVENHAFTTDAVEYINDLLDQPYVLLSNGKWLCMNPAGERYEQLN